MHVNTGHRMRSPLTQINRPGCRCVRLLTSKPGQEGNVMAATSAKAGKHEQSAEFPVPMDFENMAEVNYTAVNAAGLLSQRWCEAMMEMNGELVNFVNRRLKEDMVVPVELAECKTGTEMFEVYSNFFRTAVNQYFEEAETLAHIGKNFAGAATKVVEDEARLVHEIAAD